MFTFPRTFHHLKQAVTRVHPPVQHPIKGKLSLKTFLHHKRDNFARKNSWGLYFYFSCLRFPADICLTGEASRRESFCVTEFPDPAIRGSFPGRSEEVTAADDMDTEEASNHQFSASRSKVRTKRNRLKRDKLAKDGQYCGIAKPVQGRPAVLIGAHQVRRRLVEKEAFGVQKALSQWQAASQPIQRHVSLKTCNLRKLFPAILNSG